jgi:hypothetical protein
MIYGKASNHLVVIFPLQALNYLLRRSHQYYLPYHVANLQLFCRLTLAIQNSHPGVFACFTMKEFLPFLPTTGCQPPFKISIRSCHESNFLSKNLIPISGNLKRTSHHNMNSQIPSQVPTKQEMMQGIGKQRFGLQPITHPLFPLTEIENMKRREI